MRNQLKSTNVLNEQKKNNSDAFDTFRTAIRPVYDQWSLTSHLRGVQRRLGCLALAVWLCCGSKYFKFM